MKWSYINLGYFSPPNNATTKVLFSSTDRSLPVQNIRYLIGLPETKPEFEKLKFLIPGQAEDRPGVAPVVVTDRLTSNRYPRTTFYDQNLKQVLVIP